LFADNKQLWFTIADNVAEPNRVISVTPYIGTTATTQTFGHFCLLYLNIHVNYYHIIFLQKLSNFRIFGKVAQYKKKNFKKL